MILISRNLITADQLRSARRYKRVEPNRPLSELLVELNFISQAGEDKIFRQAKNDGLRTLAESAVEKIVSGVTTLEEVEKVIPITDTELRYLMEAGERALNAAEDTDTSCDSVPQLVPRTL